MGFMLFFFSVVVVIFVIVWSFFYVVILDLIKVVFIVIFIVVFLGNFIVFMNGLSGNVVDGIGLFWFFLYNMYLNFIGFMYGGGVIFLINIVFKF